ncbi:unnamed protein product [Caenorhabditis auriculariae]|uniref:PH domain-containing protein n=1 Tax=Caenorhabditis auriculariae TaxID=2777116 RepID=A0A8S1HQ48_9PELO|nr:unnamed protein product [Caenorhabditis auriculariae]
MRRPRPKSYVLATSASMQEDGEHPSFSQDETSRDMSSMGSLSSVEHTSRSLNAPHPPASHRLHRFIALFSHNKSTDGTPEAPKQRMKRSRTSLPSSRVPFPPTILQRDLIERQNWVKHQEIALGKSGKRRQWDDRWAILVERSLFLCLQPPSFSNEKVVELGAHTRIDIQSSIVDIAYDYLSSTPTKQRHVVRLVTQTRCEHLIELATESEMLSWITVLQSSSEGNFEPESPSSAAAPLPSTAEERISPPSSASAKPQLHNSYSVSLFRRRKLGTKCGDDGDDDLEGKEGGEEEANVSECNTRFGCPFWVAHASPAVLLLLSRPSFPPSWSLICCCRATGLSIDLLIIKLFPTTCFSVFLVFFFFGGSLKLEESD